MDPTIVFERGDDLYAISVARARITRLTATRVREWDPAVSPDGTKIAFSRGGHGISTMRADGSRPTIWTRGPDTNPAWAPDGRTIYFIRAEPAPHGASCGVIFRVSSTARPRQIRIPFAGSLNKDDPAVSPDGRRIAFSDWNLCEGGTASVRLRVVDPYGRPTRDLERLSGNGFYPNPEHSSPAWSPDGTRVAFLKDSDLNVAYRDGSSERRIARRVHAYEAPAWSPDGRWIAFGRGKQLLIVRADGTGLRRVAAVNPESLGGWLPSLPG